MEITGEAAIGAGILGAGNEAAQRAFLAAVGQQGNLHRQADELFQFQVSIGREASEGISETSGNALITGQFLRQQRLFVDAGAGCKRQCKQAVGLVKAKRVDEKGGSWSELEDESMIALFDT